MQNKIAQFIESLKSNKRLSSLDEASTKQAIVIKMLSLLEWDIFDVEEVKPDLTVRGNVVDFSLRKNKMDAVFIRVKKPSDELEKHQKEILGSAIAEGVKLAILTSGVTWWFYLAFEEGSSEQRRFCAVDLLKQKPADAALKLIGFLAKPTVTSGKALKKAEMMHGARQAHLIEKYLSEAWKSLLTHPPEALVKLVNDTFEQLGGFRADEKAIITYLNGWSRSEPYDEVIDLKEPVATPSRSYEGHSIKSFSLKGRLQPVESWGQFLVKLCEMLATEYNKDLEKLLWHSVYNKFFFREKPEDLRLPLDIEGRNIFVETALNPNDMVKVAESVLEMFGFSKKDLEIHTEEKK
jgi:hypothetical protein